MKKETNMQCEGLELLWNNFKCDLYVINLYRRKKGYILSNAPESDIKFTNQQNSVNFLTI